MQITHPSALAVYVCIAGCAAAQPAVTVQTTQPVAYQPLVVDLDTESTLSETGPVNPFLDRRLDVVFTSPTGATCRVPGFFAGDGTAATSTSSTGDIFRVRFTPDEPGTWAFTTSFRSGAEVAVDLDPLAGSAEPGNGLTGSFTVAPPDPSAPGFLAKGRLRNVGE
ncbi:MAG: DUF5060 domain-containing protein, partial [Planctomycetota bacterium]